MPHAVRPRTVLRLSGEGVREWLGNLVTNRLSGSVTFAALLTPQGKIIADFFVTDRDDHLLIDTPPHMGEPLLKRLNMFRLRAPIEIEDVSETHVVHVIWDQETERGHPDPRLPALGLRWIANEARPGEGDWDAHRLSLGVPDSEWDFGVQTTFPADACMDQLNGVDYKKGCFVGQEVVSRMKRMTTVRKRMRSVTLSGPAETGDPVKGGEKSVGTILHVHKDMAMALMRLDRLRDADQSPTVRGEVVDIMDSVLGTRD